MSYVGKDCTMNDSVLGLKCAMTPWLGLAIDSEAIGLEQLKIYG